MGENGNDAKVCYSRVMEAQSVGKVNHFNQFRKLLQEKKHETFLINFEPL